VAPKTSVIAVRVEASTFTERAVTELLERFGLAARVAEFEAAAEQAARSGRGPCSR
jgi:hypothetical protein